MIFIIYNQNDTFYRMAKSPKIENIFKKQFLINKSFYFLSRWREILRKVYMICCMITKLANFPFITGQTSLLQVKYEPESEILNVNLHKLKYCPETLTKNGVTVK